MVRLKVVGKDKGQEDQKHFNSTMVRLKGLPPLRPLSLFFNFNSTMVRLKVCSCFGLMDYLTYFNSTMVRLKENAGKGRTER